MRCPFRPGASFRRTIQVEAELVYHHADLERPHRGLGALGNCTVATGMPSPGLAILGIWIAARHTCRCEDFGECSGERSLLPSGLSRQAITVHHSYCFQRCNAANVAPELRTQSATSVPHGK